MLMGTICSDGLYIFHDQLKYGDASKLADVRLSNTNFLFDELRRSVGVLAVSSIIRLSVEILFLSLPSKTQSLGTFPAVKPWEGPKISKYPSGLTLATDSEQLDIIGRKKSLRILCQGKISVSFLCF